MTCQLRKNELKQTQNTNNNHFHGAESLLRNHQLLRQSRKSLKFMEPNFSLLCTQKPATGPCSQPDIFRPHLSTVQLKIQHNINPSTTWSSKWSDSLGISYQNLGSICALVVTLTQGSWVPSPEFDDCKKDSRFCHLRVNWS